MVNFLYFQGSGTPLVPLFLFMHSLIRQLGSSTKKIGTDTQRYFFLWPFLTKYRASFQIANEVKLSLSSGGINQAWRAKYFLYHILGAVKMRNGPYSNNVKQETDQKFPKRGAAMAIFAATQKCCKQLKKQCQKHFCH